jgi:Tfp pilus assembly protein PilN
MKISLNILPDTRKAELARRKVAFRFGMVIATVVVLAGIFNVFLISVLWSMHRYEASFLAGERKLNQEQIDELNAFDALFLEHNQKMQITQKIATDQRRYGEVLDVLSKIIPQSIVVERITFSKESAVVRGIADTRDDAIRFRESIEQEECLRSPDVPIENLVQREHLAFELSFLIDENCFTSWETL